MRTTRTHSNIAIFCGQFGTGLLHVVFSFYYVKVFLNIFHVGEYWFNIAQFLFMFWNAINDPLFGYIQDIGESWMTNRLKVFSFLGPLMSLSFLVLWFPWGSSPPYLEGLHLIVALFLYDAFFSCIGVAWSALFTESTRNHSRRVSGLKYAQMASLISSNIIALIERFSHSLDNFHEFQTLCMIIAGIATLCFFVTAHYGSMRGVLTRNRRQRAVDDRSSTAIEELAKGDLLLLGASLVNDADSSSDSEDERDRAKTKFEAALDGGVASIGDGDSKRAARPTGAIELASSRTLASSASAPTAFWREIVTVSREIIAASDFWRVVLTNFIHTCRSVLQLNFASIIVDLLIPQEILPKGSWQLSAFFAVCTALPQLLFVVNERLLLRLGAYGVFMRGFYVSIASSMALYFFAAAGNPYIIMLFIVVDTIAIHATSPLFNILFAEFVEDDALRNKRRQTMSSLIFSLNALIVKPSISITPVIAVYLMNRSGYELYRSNGERTPELIACGLRFTFWAPLFLAALEVLTLGGYSLRADFRTSSSGAADKPRREMSSCSLAIRNATDVLELTNSSHLHRARSQSSKNENLSEGSFVYEMEKLCNSINSKCIERSTNGYKDALKKDIKELKAMIIRHQIDSTFPIPSELATLVYTAKALCGNVAENSIDRKQREKLIDTIDLLSRGLYSLRRIYFVSSDIEDYDNNRADMYNILLDAIDVLEQSIPRHLFSLSGESHI